MSEFRERLVSPKVYEENLKNYLEKMKKVKEIIIWGAAIESPKIYRFLQEFNLEHKVIGYADNDSKKWGRVLNNVKVLSPNEVLERAKVENNLCVIVAIIPKSQVEQQLISEGLSKDNIDMIGIHIADSYYDYKNNLYETIQMYMEVYEKVYTMLQDTYSKKTYLAKLNAKLSGDGKYLKNISNGSKQYFDRELIKLRADEIFVDCGSWIGDTLDVFYTLTNGRYKKYIALEADTTTYKELMQKIKKGDYKNIEVLNNACWNEETELKFLTQSSAGHITEKGNLIIKADRLDHLINEPVTFIKMDIEGAEENALKGAKKLIRTYKPILAICIYHSIEDYYKLPLLIKELNNEYQLYIRHYGEVDIETVCYAIPKERLI